ncbi:MAG: ABC transporter permease subunit [Bacteroidetes bacterium]|nr:ABC transporter permease subunit [Bacteroidota bacterium]
MQALILGVVGLILFVIAWWLLAEYFAISRSEFSANTQIENEEAEAVSITSLEDADPLDNRLPEDAQTGTYTGIRIQAPGVDTASINIRLEDNAGGLFRVHPKTGEVHLAEARLDYEYNTVHTIVASANAADGRQFSSNFTIQVRDRNEFGLSELRDADDSPNEIFLNAGPQTYVGLTALAEDGDKGDKVTYRFLNHSKGLFQINSDDGRVILKDTAALYRQSPGSLDLKIVASSTDFTADTARFTIQLKQAEASDEQVALSEKVYPILPTPGQVIKSYPSLVKDDALARNTFKSIWLNMQGYWWAILISIPIGFIIGLFPLFRGLFSKQVDALRYLPLTALTGLFIIWFGIEDQMKIAFLAFGIIVYLLPVVVQRVDEVREVFTQTVFTLGASKWQTIRSVYIPSVMSKVIDDIRVLTAISWTYIIIAELLNREEGIGSLIYIKARQGQIAKVFAILLVIILIGFVQDRLFVYMDRRLFPHKYNKSKLNGLRETEYGIFTLILLVSAAIIVGILAPAFAPSMVNLVYIVALAAIVIIIYGEIKLNASRRQNS